MSQSSNPCARLVLTGVTLAVLTACGGGSSGVAPAVNNNNAGVTDGDKEPAPVSMSCYDGQQANPVGAEDPFYFNAWHLKNTGPGQQVSAVNNQGVAGIDAHVENVHKNGLGCTGKGVTIAIVDTGMEINHEDLKPNVLAGKSWNFLTNTDDPSPALNMDESDHGTAVAGIAASRGWNGVGARGTAPLASLVAYPLVELKFEYEPEPSERTNMYYLAFGAQPLADKTKAVTTKFGDRADGTSIFNFSAGWSYAAPTEPDNENQDESPEVWGTRHLRGGLGAIYFQAAGNAYQDMEGVFPDGTRLGLDCSAWLTEDAEILGGQLTNLAGMSCGNSNQEPSGKPYFYQVAAMHNTGKASSYSSSGAANWITGFAGEFGTDEAAIITTDNSTCSSGYNNKANKDNLLAQFGNILSKLVADLLGEPGSKDPQCNYTGRMNGTSAATPSVAGVAALMLEANPKLTWQDVGYILARTARKVDDTIASGERAARFNPLGEGAPWSLEDPWITNAAGFNFQNRYGFGLVDADAAVKLAANYSPPAGRRDVLLNATGTAAEFFVMNEVGTQGAVVTFADKSAKTGPIRVDLTLENTTGYDINPGALQFQLVNLKTNTKSILLPAFTSWYVGGQLFPIKDKATQRFRFHTNAFFGESLDGEFVVQVVDFSGASVSQDKMLKFTPTLTSFSL